MNRKYTLLVVVAAVVLIGLAFWQRDAKPIDLAKGTPTATPGPILGLDPQAVQEVAVAGAAGKQTVLKRAAGGWQVDGLPAALTVDGTISNVVRLSAFQSLPTSLKPADYGFTSPTLTVTLKTAAGEATVLRVGDDVVGDTSTSYLLVGTADQPILVVSSADLKTMRDWLTTKPLAPTATPPGAGGAGTPGAPGAEAPVLSPEEGTATPEVGMPPAATSPPPATPTATS